MKQNCINKQIFHYQGAISSASSPWSSHSHGNCGRCVGPSHSPEYEQVTQLLFSVDCLLNKLGRKMDKLRKFGIENLGNKLISSESKKWHYGKD